jgi:hypothetical protein
MFTAGPEQQYYRRVHAILKMVNPYSAQRLDKTCYYAIKFNASNKTEQTYLREEPVIMTNSTEKINDFIHYLRKMR